MGKYISLGQFNKYYFFILGSISINILITFIIGIYPTLTPSKPIFLFGFKPSILTHPVIKNIFQYFGIGLGGLIFQYAFLKKNKDIGKIFEEEKEADRSLLSLPNNKLSDLNRSTTSLLYNEIIVKNKISYNKKIFFVFFFYYFSRIIISSFDNLGFHQTKFWTLEFISLLYFSKKILLKKIYKHQIIALSIVLIFSTLLYIINSFIPESDKKCSPLDEECKLLNSNVYQEIKDKLNWFSIPIIIFLYLLAMTFNAYASVRFKWFIDFKYITIYKIAEYIGIIGFIFSIILLIFFSLIPCSESKDFIKFICTYEYEGRKYYDNFRNLKELDMNIFIFYELVFIIPLFLILNFVNFIFILLIIEKLDPFYLIPIDTCYFIIYQTIDYCVTLNKTNKMNNIRFIIANSSDFICILCCCIYLEIFELHCFGLDKDTRRSIILRGLEEEKSNELTKTNNINDTDSEKNNQNFDKNEDNNINMNKDKKEDMNEDNYSETKGNLNNSYNVIEDENYITYF